VKPGHGNPLPLILPAVEMLRDLGEPERAGRILAAVEAVLTEGEVRPADLGGTATAAEFTAAVAGKV
jgi:isocitrate dehydrogenase (NAD+)